MAERTKASHAGGIESTAGATSQETYDHPTAKIWSVYMSEANMYDKALIESWSKDMDGILIFAGLFSASITAFIIESYAGLMPDPNASTVALLQQISQQLAGNGSQTQTVESDSFSPTTSSLRVNAFWFLSLCLALTCALAATLVQQWARNYLQAIQRRPAPYVQARIRSYLHEGIETFKMTAVVEGIPTLLHISVFLFFVGLVDFLYQINLTIAWVTLSIVATCVALYILITILPVFHRQSPFRTPLSELFWAICRFSDLLRYRVDNKWQRLDGSMWQGRETVAHAVRRTERDVVALTWTLNNLTEDKELLPFVEGIPAFCGSGDGLLQMKFLMSDNTQLPNDKAQLLPRIIALLQTCRAPSNLPLAARSSRSVACLNAINTLCGIYVAFSAPSWDFLYTYEPRLRDLIMPMTEDEDLKVAGAAILAAATVAVHIKSCMLCVAAQDTHESYGDQAAHLNRSHSAEFDWAFEMLKSWHALEVLADMIPSLENDHELADAYSMRIGRFPFRPEFKDAVLQFLAKNAPLLSGLDTCMSIDLGRNERLRRRALSFLAGTVYSACLTATFYGEPPSYPPSAYMESGRLDYFSSHCSSQLVSTYATCVLVHMAIPLQRDIFQHPNRALTFGRAISNEDIHPIRDLPSKTYVNSDVTFLDKLDESTRQLYEKLPPAEQLKLSSLPEDDGWKSLFLYRGHIHLLIALLRPFCTMPQQDIGALELANRAITDMHPYLDARFSCRRDQERLVDLCKSIFDGPGGRVDLPVPSERRRVLPAPLLERIALKKPPQPPLWEAFIKTLLGVLGTISDPSLLDIAITVLKSEPVRLYDEAAAALHRLKSVVPLEPLQDNNPPDDYCVEPEGEVDDISGFWICWRG